MPSTLLIEKEVSINSEGSSLAYDHHLSHQLKSTAGHRPPYNANGQFSITTNIGMYLVNAAARLMG